ncbi:hypothetical protein ILUMI_06231 [Ignelater luminosus]|uniref:Uncharacterized protein n=1 Tax=Ignelater luminosus TaxID=2038154 RepID=A0A8K0D668_IGNLU|nr:hypothetical protein ILUMI_06231 [Ignelater luminosus]
MFKFFKYEAPENDTQFNEYTECVWNKLEYLTEDGDVDYEKLKNSYEIERKVGEDHPKVLIQLDKFRVDAVNKCEIDRTSLKADTAGKTAVRVQNCIVKNFLEISEPTRF